MGIQLHVFLTVPPDLVFILGLRYSHYVTHLDSMAAVWKDNNEIIYTPGNKITKTQSKLSDNGQIKSHEEKEAVGKLIGSINNTRWIKYLSKRTLPK